MSHNPTTHPPDILGMDSDEMRRLGYKVVDLVVDRAINRAGEPVIHEATPEALRAALGGPLPETPMDADTSLDLLAGTVLLNMQHGDHPRYFARVPGPAAFAAILGEWLGTGYNAIATSWGGASGPATLELVVIGWLAELLGLPEHTEGVLLSGGSHANLTAFAVARSELGDGVAYYTDQTHASLPRNLRAMGWSPAHLRMLQSSDRLRMDPDRLRQTIAADRDRGLTPKLVIATAGTTNTGAADPLDDLADICAEQGLWLHVDGAYGGPAALTEQGRAYLHGLARADSLVIDPHKWLFQPYDVGACFVTHPGALERCFAMNPEYLKDVKTTQGAVNFGDRSLELTRRSRALKLWMSLRTYGAGRLRTAVAHGIEMAEYAESCLRDAPQTWEIISPAQIGVVCFALRDAEPSEHARRAAQLTESGFAAVTSTTLKGRSVLRLCTINPTTTKADVAEVIRRLSVP